METTAFFEFQIGVAGAVMVLASFVLSKTWTNEAGRTIFQSLNVGGGLFLFVHALFLGSLAYIVLSIIFTFVSIERLNRILFLQSSLQTNASQAASAQPSASKIRSQIRAKANQSQKKSTKTSTKTNGKTTAKKARGKSSKKSSK